MEKVVKGKYCHIGQSKKGGDLPVFANSGTAAVLESLDALF